MADENDNRVDIWAVLRGDKESFKRVEKEMSKAMKKGAEYGRSWFGEPDADKLGEHMNESSGPKGFESASVKRSRALGAILDSIARLAPTADAAGVQYLAMALSAVEDL